MGGVCSALLDHLRHRQILPAGLIAEARAAHLRDGTLVQDALLAQGGMDETDLLDAMEGALGGGRADGPLIADARQVARIGLATCLVANLAPLGRQGAVTVIASSRPGEVLRRERHLTSRVGRFRVVLAPRDRVEAAILSTSRVFMANRAEDCVPADESCRGWSERKLLLAGIAAGLTFAATALLAPTAMLAGLTLLAIVVLVAATGLRVAAAWAALGQSRSAALNFRTRRRPAPGCRPVVSVLVPLYREREIAGRLIRRLAQLTYPKDRLEICLVLEEDDIVTRAALAQARLPHWMRVVEVPRGTVKTKPRALNYALGLCRGEIVGIYDAEDAPEPDQIDRIVERFAHAPPDVACLQGVLDFYNPRANWLSRCFTIEYATWFRLVLPGLERLGMVVPLGGTTLFFRRHALEKLGRWDAHNVTEDADLGLRLARHGMRCELIATVTGEEANCRPLPWVRQRSRWLKGYAMTGACHLRDPARLWRDLGPRRFWGVQVLFLGTVLQYLLAPLLWSFWIELFGWSHPLAGVIGPAAMRGAEVTFALAEAANLAVAVIAVATTAHRGLGWWVPTMHLYFPLGTLAAWKGLIEIATRPYYWDKTMHGHSAPIRGDDRRRLAPLMSRRAS